MRRRRMIVVVLALALGGVAGAIAYVYLSGVQSRAYADARLTSVYVARNTIPRGMSGSAAFAAGLLERTVIPVKFSPIGAIQDPQSIRTGFALAQIPPRQVIVSSLFGVTPVTGGLAAQQIPPGDVAITISVDSVHGVAGLVQPGDRVDMLVELTNGSKESSLYQNVPVLATGTNVSGVQGQSSSPQGGTSSSSSGLVTFAVPLRAAERIALAESGAGTSGSIYLALVPPGNKAAAVPAVTPQNLIPSSPTPK